MNYQVVQGLPELTPGTPPPGYPKAGNGCPGATDIYDTIALTLQIKVPANAQGLSFDFDFYSGEWPEFVCTPYNDAFVAWLTSSAFPGKGGDLNISFDMNGNPVSVNNGFFDRCTSNTVTGCAGVAAGNGGKSITATASCPGGQAELQGTGFFNQGSYTSAQGLAPVLSLSGIPSQRTEQALAQELPSQCQSATQTTSGGGATGWLTSSAPVKAGETITIQFIIWDTGDNNWDSSVLVDNFRWKPGQTTVVTQRPAVQ